MTPLQVRKQLGVGISQEDGDMQSLVSAEVEASLTGADLKKSLEDQNQAIADIEQEMKDTREAKTGELAELRMELERVQAELDAKKSALMAELEQKKRYMEQMKDRWRPNLHAGFPNLCHPLLRRRGRPVCPHPVWPERLYHRTHRHSSEATVPG